MYFASGNSNSTYLLMSHLTVFGGRAVGREAAEGVEEELSGFGGALLLSGNGYNKFFDVSFEHNAATEVWLFVFF